MAKETEKIINPFKPQDIAFAELPSEDSRYGSDVLDNVKEMQIGKGNFSFNANESGIWLGAKLFKDAPFSVDMEGNMVATSLDLSGYLKTGEALSDVQGSTTTLSGIRSNLGTITAGSITGVTITGGTVRTSSGTTRVQMSGANNAFEVYYGGDLRGSFNGYQLTFLGPNEVGGGAIWSAGSNQINIDTGGASYEFNDSALYTTDSCDLGDSSYPFYNVYADGTAYLTGKLKIPVGTNLY